MAWVADYTSRIPPAALKGAGVVGVSRYVSRHGWKVVDQAEYDELRAADITVVLNFEDEATGWLGGASAGVADANFSADRAEALGYPAGAPIPSSADFDMTSTQWKGPGADYALAYQRTLRSHGYRPGVYGPYYVLGWCQQVGYDWFWQAGMSTSWSAGHNANAWPGAHLRQRFKTIVGGLEVDHSDILREDWADVALLTDADLAQLRAVMQLIQNEYGWIAKYLNDKDGTAYPVNATLHQILAATGSVAAPSQDQVNAAVAAVMNDPAWMAKMAAANAAAFASHVTVKVS